MEGQINRGEKKQSRDDHLATLKVASASLYWPKYTALKLSCGQRFALHQGSVPNNFLISVLASFMKKPSELVSWKTELVFSLK